MFRFTKTAYICLIALIVSFCLMLLDLARNDLYTCCDHESVRVRKNFAPEVYSHLIHIVSEVEGKLKKNAAPLDLFKSSFPAGTVSGAPKTRAMELIDQYESRARGFYGGCAGYFGYGGNIDTCIAIRSALITTATFFVDTRAALCCRIIMGRAEAKSLATLNLRPLTTIQLKASFK